MISDGFDTGGRTFPWGTTLTDVLTRLPGCIKSDDRSAKYQSARALGLTGILSTTVHAPAPDRPVMQIWYELAAVDGNPLEEISRIFGVATESTRYDISHYSNPSSAVSFVAGWQVPGFRMGLSIYGAPRSTPDGVSAAALYVDWEDEIAAAVPYLAEMDKAERLLEQYATNAEIIGSELLEKDQHPYCTGPNDFAQFDETLWRAQRCLRRRHLYQTPAALAHSMQANQVLVWQNIEEKIWCISTQYETVYFPLSQPVPISHTNILPAKGSGASYLTASDLGLVSISRSPAMTRLAVLLKGNSLAQIRFEEDDDC